MKNKSETAAYGVQVLGFVPRWFQIVQQARTSKRQANLSDLSGVDSFREARQNPMNRFTIHAADCGARRVIVTN